MHSILQKGQLNEANRYELKIFFDRDQLFEIKYFLDFTVKDGS